MFLGNEVDGQIGPDRLGNGAGLVADALDFEANPLPPRRRSAGFTPQPPSSVERESFALFIAVPVEPFG